MDYFRYLGRIIELGMEGARRDYEPDDPRLEGSLDAFARCRGMPPQELLRLHYEARARVAQLHGSTAPEEEYWRALAFATELEWVLNVLGAGLGMQPIGVPITARGVMTAAKILGVRHLEVAPQSAVAEARGLQHLLAVTLPGLALGRCDELLLPAAAPSQDAVLALMRSSAELARCVAPLGCLSLNAVLWQLLQHVEALMGAAGFERPTELSEALRAQAG